MKKSIGAKTIIYPTPVFIVGSYDQDGSANMMNAAWGGICCSEPPCVNVSIRKSRYTYANILAKRAFTINIPSKKYVQEADYFGMVTGKDINKLEVTGLTAVKAELVDAPYIGEFPLILECKLLKTVEIGVHTMFIGEIIDAKVEEFFLDEELKPLIEKIEPMVYVPGEQKYRTVGDVVAEAFSCGKVF